ncbi:uncharacterized mitochondrial protein AtMg00810-like [Benincasa hispida]|uniref:uncharacterized mitochondrial protein AtMg00810-like n=1 Tax=Benincasa hispida TaxID=102211 RepID=UPI0019002461|nr:uncharacterized mitochondrial protein AtMg00810-like [Benincasa hispida]
MSMKYHALISWGFKNSKADTSLFIFHFGNSILLLLVYVDDVIVTSNNSHLITKLIKSLGRKFALKDLGALTYCLGIQLHHLEAGFVINQAKYIEDLLSKLNLFDLNPALTPCTMGKKLSATDGVPLLDPYIYRSTIGALQYLTRTRPDIAYIVNHLSKFLKAPTDIHWQATKRVLMYVSGIRYFGLLFEPSTNLDITAFSNADWASNIDDRCSVATYCIFIDNNLVSWSSKEQTVMARSSIELEYRALAQASAGII